MGIPPRQHKSDDIPDYTPDVARRFAKLPKALADLGLSPGWAVTHTHTHGERNWSYKTALSTELVVAAGKQDRGLKKTFSTPAGLRLWGTAGYFDKILLRHLDPVPLRIKIAGVEMRISVPPEDRTRAQSDDAWRRRAAFGFAELQGIARPGKRRVVVDVGGSVGIFAMMAHKLDPDLLVLSFDPSPINYWYLKYNLWNNGIKELSEDHWEALSIGVRVSRL